MVAPARRSDSQRSCVIMPPPRPLRAHVLRARSRSDTARLAGHLYATMEVSLAAFDSAPTCPRPPITIHQHTHTRFTNIHSFIWVLAFLPCFFPSSVAVWFGLVLARLRGVAGALDSRWLRSLFECRRSVESGRRSTPGRYLLFLR